jgi:hypothetical protein
MSQKSSVPQAISFVSRVLKRDTRYHENDFRSRGISNIDAIWDESSVAKLERNHRYRS